MTAVNCSSVMIQGFFCVLILLFIVFLPLYTHTTLLSHTHLAAYRFLGVCSAHKPTSPG